MSQARILRAKALLRRFHVRETNVRRRAPLSWEPVGIPVEGAPLKPSGKIKRITVEVPRFGNPFLLRPHPLAPSSAEYHSAKAAATLNTRHKSDSGESSGTTTATMGGRRRKGSTSTTSKGSSHLSGRSNMIPSRYSLRRQKELLKAAQLLSTIPESEGGDPLAVSRLPRSPKALLKLVKVQDRVGLGRAGAANAAQRAKDRAAADNAHQRPVGVLADIIDASGGGKLSASSSMTKAQLKKDLRLRAFLPPALRTTEAASDRFKQGTLSAEVSKVIWVGRPKPKSERGLKVGFKLHGWEREAGFRRKNTEALVEGMDAKIRKFLNVSRYFLVWALLESVEGATGLMIILFAAYREERAGQLELHYHFRWTVCCHLLSRPFAAIHQFVTRFSIRVRVSNFLAFPANSLIVGYTIFAVYPHLLR